jgi:hypothetical protein
MKAKVTISRASDDRVRIRIRDEASGIEFAEVSLTVEAYGYAITGLSEQEAELSVRGLEWVGKKRVTESRQKVCPLDTCDKDKLSKWLQENAQEEGWILSTYLGSQSSTSRASCGGTLLRYSVTKYVEA